jgi:hypothetical protein
LSLLMRVEKHLEWHLVMSATVKRPRNFGVGSDFFHLSVCIM